MKTVVTIKMFLVLCCSTNATNNSGYSYEVQELNGKEGTGVMFTQMEYNQGDTIKIVIPTRETVSLN